nr:uncharacterized protein LOC111420989 [Onthophagus taurus]
MMSKTFASILMMVFVAFNCNIQSLKAQELTEGKCEFGTKLNETCAVLLTSVDNVVNLTMRLVQEVLEEANAFVKTMLDSIINNSLFAFFPIITEFKDIVTKLLTGAVTFVDKITELLKNFISKILEVLQKLVSIILALVGSAAKGIINVVNTFMKNVIDESNAMSAAVDIIAECFEVKRHHHIVHKKLAVADLVNKRKNLIN